MHQLYHKLYIKIHIRNILLNLVNSIYTKLALFILVSLHLLYLLDALTPGLVEHP